MRILILGPWAIARPRHGGQIRAANIVQAYSSEGHEVKFVGVYDPGNVPLSDTTRDDVPIDHAVMHYIHHSGLPWEISLWRAFVDVKPLYERFVAVVRDFRPDIVQFEEPYLWPLVRALRGAGELGRARVIHSSYNFETQYRRELGRIAGHLDEAVLGDVALQERQIARECDMVITVSDDDADSFKKLGAPRVIVARNGSSAISPSPAAVRAVDGYTGGAPFALFVSSAHPPNAEGLLHFVDGIEETLPGKLFVCGAVYRLLAERRKKHRLLRDADMWGMVEPQVLEALLSRASVVLLPKTSGGGSNLKTSEALLARRPVVATRLAFTGFEDWQDLSGVEIEDDPMQFWQRVAHRLESTEPAWNGQADARRNELLWEACLAPMLNEVTRQSAGSAEITHDPSLIGA